MIGTRWILAQHDNMKINIFKFETIKVRYLFWIIVIIIGLNIKNNRIILVAISPAF